MKSVPLVLVVMVALGSGLVFAQRDDRGVRVQGRQAPGTEQRVALVIGNSAYKAISPLKNPVNDAEDMATALRRSGFKVTLLQDATRKQMNRAIRDLGRLLQKGGVGLFYYAGHGVQVGGVNYLVPLGAEITQQFEVEDEAVSANRVLGMMEAAGNRLNMVFLDACRNNPYKGRFRSAGQGLAAVRNAPKGSLISYATGAGAVAEDGTGRNGTYTKNLLRYIHTPGLELTTMMKRVRTGVRTDTQGRQIPYELSSLEGDFYFARASNGSSAPATITKTQPPAAPPPRQSINAEEEFWKVVKDSKNPGYFRAYLRKYPQGRFADIAKIKIEMLALPQQSTLPQPKMAEVPGRPNRPRVAMAEVPSAAKRDKSSRRIWAAKLEEMKRSARLVVAYERQNIPPKAMINAWRRFLSAFKEDNPYTTQDDLLRSQAKTRITLWQREQRRVADERRRREAERRRQAAIRRDSGSRTWRDPVTGMEFVKVPGGSFEMGCHSNAGRCSRNEKPVRTVRLDGFWMGKHEVTQGQWKRIMGNNPSRFKKGDNYPVEQVSWNDVQNFIRRLNSQSSAKFSLPSEAQWEYACRAGGKAVTFGTGNGQVSTGNANYSTNNGGTTPVGRYQANSLGLHDLSGNVYEWVQDKKTSYQNVGTDNPTYNRSGAYRVVRGGSWRSSSGFLRCSHRFDFIPSDSFSALGFRLVRVR